MRTVLLLDVDGTLLDKEKDWLAIEKTFMTMYPHTNAGEVREFYRAHRGPLHSVDDAIEAGLSVYGGEFWRVFYETDHRQALQPDVRALLNQCELLHVRTNLFTEGSVGFRSWLPEHAANGFQDFKVEQLNLGISALVFDDKVTALPQVIDQFVNEGYEQVILLDDRIDVLRAGADLGCLTYLMAGKDTPENWLTGQVGSLTDMARALQRIPCE